MKFNVCKFKSSAAVSPEKNEADDAILFRPGKLNPREMII